MKLTYDENFKKLIDAAAERYGNCIFEAIRVADDIGKVHKCFLKAQCIVNAIGDLVDSLDGEDKEVARKHARETVDALNKKAFYFK